MASCEDKIDLDLPEGEKLLVVEGWISNEPGPHHVKLSFTAPYFEEADPPPAVNAAVVLRDDEGEVFVLDETSAGIYSFADSGRVGRSYTLDITLADGEQYTSAPELLRAPVPITDIYWEVDPDGPSEFLEQEEDQIYAVLIDTFEPPGRGDNYRWRVIVNGRFKNDPFDIAVTNDDFVDGNSIEEFSPINELFREGDTVTVVQERISRHALEFLQLLQQQTAFVGSPFDTPPAPNRGNVTHLTDPDKRALGFFGAAARDRATVVAGRD